MLLIYFPLLLNPSAACSPRCRRPPLPQPSLLPPAPASSSVVAPAAFLCHVIQGYSPSTVIASSSAVVDSASSNHTCYLSPLAIAVSPRLLLHPLVVIALFLPLLSVIIFHRAIYPALVSCSPPVATNRSLDTLLVPLLHLWCFATITAAQPSTAHNHCSSDPVATHFFLCQPRYRWLPTLPPIAT
ncbi:hypothetical protein BHE74_00011402 [Ensete ventricosum]|nr:hypothetical protein GW17_00036300 [Ensete ventricosum]RWW80263.1 hypothetical protein BHE74_00011402 [Ensete ventricosum]